MPLRIRLNPMLSAPALLAVAMFAVPFGCEMAHTAVSPDPAAPPLPQTARASDPSTPPQTASTPGRYATRRGYCVFYHDFELDRDDPLFAELEELPEQVISELQLPPCTAVVQVFLFDTQERYERYMKLRYRKLPTRRAYFLDETRVGGPPDLKVYTWMGDHLRTDLRHELTHALLHGVLKDVPLWLDEGLAGFFEVPPANDGVNPKHLDLLRRGPFQPGLGRLERLTEVQEMQQLEYREAWAWVHLMLRSTPAAKAVLHDYLQSLRTTDKPGLLLARFKEVVPDPDRALADHLANIEMPKGAGKN